MFTGYPIRRTRITWSWFFTCRAFSAQLPPAPTTKGWLKPKQNIWYLMVYLYTSWYISIHHGISLYMVYLYLYTSWDIYICWLVVLTILTNMKVNGQDHPIYYGKNKKMFQTTNQYVYIMVYLYTSWYISIHGISISLYIMRYIYICWLVVLTILTNMKVNGQDHPIYYGKLKKMFQTTNQYVYIMVYLYILGCLPMDIMIVMDSSNIYIYMITQQLMGYIRYNG